jgi:hypothetical protein
MTDAPWLDCMDGFTMSEDTRKPVAANDLTPRQRQVLEAVVDLVRGGMDMEEIFFCYKIISDYVRNSTINTDQP